MVETRNANFKYRKVWKTYANTSVDTDANGDCTISIPELRIVKSVLATIAGGYKAELQSISGKTIKVRVYDYPGTPGGVATAKANGTDLAAMDILAMGY